MPGQYEVAAAAGVSWILCGPSEPVLRFSSAAVLIDHRGRHHCSIAESPFAFLNRRKDASRRFEHSPIFFPRPLALLSSFSVSLSRMQRRRIHFYRCSKLCVFSSGFPATPISTCHIPPSRYVREHSPRYECRCALSRISPEEARGWWQLVRLQASSTSLSSSSSSSSSRDYRSNHFRLRASRFYERFVICLPHERDRGLVKIFRWSVPLLSTALCSPLPTG